MDDQVPDQTQQALTPDQQPATPLPWPEVIKKPEFQAMPPEDQEGARQQYFNDVVSPQIPKEDLGMAKQQFDSQFGPDRKTTLGDIGQQIKSDFEGTGAMAGPISTAVQFLGHLGRSGTGEERPPGYPITQSDTDPAGERTQPIDPSIPAAAAGMTSSAAGNPLAGGSVKGFLKDINDTGFLQDETTRNSPGGITPIRQTPKTADDSLAASQYLYKTADEKGGMGGSQTVMNKWLDNIQDQIPKEEKAVTNARGGTPSKTQTLIDNLENNRNQMISYRGLDQLDKYLGNEAHQAFKSGDNLTGSNIAQINDMLLQTMKDAPAGALPGAEYGEAARQAFMQQLKMRKLESITAFAANTKNPATSVQAQLRNLYKRESNSKTSPWTPEELEGANKAANTGDLTDLFQTLGNRLSVFAAGHGLLGKAAAFVASKAAREGANYIQYGKAQDLARIISNSTPSPYDIKGVIPRIQRGETIPDAELQKSVQ